MAKRGLRAAWMGRKRVRRQTRWPAGVFEIFAKLCAARFRIAAAHKEVHAQVGERLKPTDCKSVGLRSTKVRILPCAPFFRRSGAL